MKLLLLTSEFPPYRGGVATYAVELARAASAIGHDVTVAAPGYDADQSAIDDMLPFRVIRFAGGANTPRAIVDKVAWTRAHARDHGYDLVHAIDWPFFLPLALSRYRRSARCVLTFHGTEINMMRRRSRSALLTLVRFWSGWATAVANSHFTARHLLKTFPQLDPANVIAVPLGVRPPDDVPQTDRASARLALKLDPDMFAMVTLGRIVERKGHHILAQALNLLPQEAKASIRWYVVGPENDAAYTARIKAMATASGVECIFTGGVPAAEMECFLSAADLFCLPAIWGRNGEFEGFGLVYLEAGLRGVPAIGSDLGGIPDAVIDGETGLLAPPGDAQALADAILRIATDTELRNRLARNALAHARASTWEKVARESYA